MADRGRPTSDAPRRRRRRGNPVQRAWSRPVPGWSVPLIIVAVLLAGEAAARLIGPSVPRTAGSEERMLIKADQIADRGPDATDVVVLGSSETAGGIVPELVDREATQLDGAYNAALVGPTMALTREWSERVVLPHLEPEVAVIGMLPMSVLDDDFVAQQSGLDEQRQAIAAYRSALDQVDPGGFAGLGWDLRRRSDLVRWRPYLRSPVTTAKATAQALRGGPEGEDQAPDPDFDWLKETDPVKVRANTGDGGDIFDYHRPSTPTDADPVGAQLYNLFGTGSADFTQLEKLVDAIEARGITPVIAIAPADRATLEAGGADLTPLDDLAAQIEAWAAERGIEVDDQFTEEWDPALFHDRNHLDQAGAEAWSEHVGRWLTELCAAGKLEDACPER